MRLNTIRVTNILGVADAELRLGTSPLAVICGDNAVGKSSFREAITLAFLGVADRAPAKKDWQKLVTDGALSGAVAIELEGGESCRLKLPSGSGVSPLSGLEDADRTFAQICLGARMFLAEKPKDRRALVGKLYANAEAHGAVAAKLVERGHPSEMVAAITPLLRAGTEAAKADCDRRATEAKGAWKGITGEVWGKVKAAEWEPAGEAGRVTVRRLEDLSRAHQQAEDRIAEANRQIGAARAQMTVEQRDALKALAADYAPREAARVAARRELDRLVTKAQDLRASLDRARSGEPLQCPHCQHAVELANGVLVPHAPMPAADLAVIERALEAVNEDGRKAKLQYQELAARAEEADRAARQLDAAQQQPPVDVAELEAELADAQAARAQIAADHEAHKAHAAWHSARSSAATQHRSVLAWLALSESLADPDIGTTGASHPVAEFNTALVQVSDAIGWPATTLGEDGAVYFGGRIAEFISESDRWKANATVAISLAQRGLGLVMLDRVDVLAPQARPALFRYLAEDSQLGTALTFATLKSPPTVPASVAVLWLGEALQAAA